MVHQTIQYGNMQAYLKLWRKTWGQASVGLNLKIKSQGQCEMVQNNQPEVWKE